MVWVRSNTRLGEGRALTFSLTGFMFPPPQVGPWGCWSPGQHGFLCQPWVVGPWALREERCEEGMGVQTGAQGVWQEMLGRRKLGWCWELEERRGERKTTLRLRLAAGRGKTRRAKLWRGGQEDAGCKERFAGSRAFHSIKILPQA